MGNLVQATDSFAIGIKGEEHLVHRGEIFDDDHEIVRKASQNFAPLHIRGEVEAATAAPGETRKTRTKKTDAAKADAADK